MEWEELERTSNGCPAVGFRCVCESASGTGQSANGTLLSLWWQTIKTGGKWDGSHMFSSVLADSGKHWSAPVRVHSDASPSEHSFSSAIPVDAGRAALIWLDARDFEKKGRYRLMSALIDSSGLS